MGRQTQTKSAGRQFLEEPHLDKNTSWHTEQNGKHRGSQQRSNTAQSLTTNQTSRPARIRGMLLCLPCHRQRGGCELFQLPKPEHTSDEAEKGKRNLSDVNTEATRVMEQGTSSQWQTCQEQEYPVDFTYIQGKRQPIQTYRQNYVSHLKKRLHV